MPQKIRATTRELPPHLSQDTHARLWNLRWTVFLGLAGVCSFLVLSCLPVSDPGLILCTDDNQCWNRYKCLPEANQTGKILSQLVKRCTPPGMTAPPVEPDTIADSGATPDTDKDEAHEKDTPPQCKSDDDCSIPFVKCCEQRCSVRLACN